MSSLLEQAIIDAKLLRETAQKNAEAALLDKYQDRVKQSIEMLLEQDDASLPDLGDSSSDFGENTPSLEPDIGDTSKPSKEVKKITDKIPPSYLGEDNLQEVEINLDSIIEKIDSMEKELNMKMPDFSTSSHESSLEENKKEEKEECLEEGGCQEEKELEEIENLEEELVLDFENVSPGGIQGNEIELKKQYNIAKALEAQNEELNEELNSKVKELDSMEEKLQSALLKLQETRSKLKKTTEINSTLKESFQILAKKVKEVNLLNSRLLYTNKILGNSSLNERQKKQIAESISEAKTVEEAKTIYETLQRSADAVVERRQAPQSLTEAINRGGTAFLPRSNDAINPVKDRWQKIAGITSKK